MRKRKCIVTYARSWIALAAARCLGRHGIHVITGDTTRAATANFSRYSREQFIYPDPNTDPEGFIDRLVAIAKAHAEDDTDLVIMPMYTDIYPILCNKDRFDALAKLALPPKKAYELVRNKAEIADHCNRMGVRIPPTIVVGSADEFHDRARDIGYPAFVKMPTSSGSMGIHKVSSQLEAVRVFDDMVSSHDIAAPGLFPILQEFVGGKDYCSTFLFDNGEYRASMTYRNVVDFPKGKGVGVLRETVEAHDLEEIGRKVLQELGWNGVCQVDFRWDGVSEPWLIEINPRFWGGLAQSVASGWDFPLWLYDLALEGQIGPQTPEKIDVRTSNPALMILRVFQELFSARESVGIGRRIKAVAGLFKECRGAVNEYFSWEDPLPILGLIYPIMVYIEHGKITPALLIGEKGVHKNAPGV